MTADELHTDPIPGLAHLAPDKMSVSDVGITKRARMAFWRRVVPTDSGCWMWTGAVSSEGYGRITWTMPSGKPKTMSTHRFALHLAHGGRLPDGLVGDHACNHPLCVRVHPDHLRLSTQSDNLAWAVYSGRAHGRRVTVSSRHRREASLAQRERLLGRACNDPTLALFDTQGDSNEP